MSVRLTRLPSGHVGRQRRRRGQRELVRGPWTYDASLASGHRNSADDPAQSPESRLLGAAVETVPELARQASPITHVTGAFAPMLWVHGTHDDGIPLVQSDLLVEAYSEVDAELLRLQGAGHGFHGIQLDQALTVGADFLGQYL